MIAVCQSCKAEYNLDLEKVPARGGFLTCRACGERIGLPTRDSVPMPQLPVLDVPPPPPPAFDLAPQESPPPPPAFDPGSQELSPPGVVPTHVSAPVIDMTLPEWDFAAPSKPAVIAPAFGAESPAPIVNSGSGDEGLASPSFEPALDLSGNADDLPAPLVDPAPHAVENVASVEAGGSQPNEYDLLADLPARVLLSEIADSQAPATAVQGMSFDDLPAPDGEDVARLDDLLLTAVALRQPPEVVPPSAPSPVAAPAAAFSDDLPALVEAAAVDDASPQEIETVESFDLVDATDVSASAEPVEPVEPVASREPSERESALAPEVTIAGTVEVAPVLGTIDDGGEDAFESSVAALRSAPAAPALMDKIAPAVMPTALERDATEAVAGAADALGEAAPTLKPKRRRLVLVAGLGLAAVAAAALGTLGVLHRGPFATLSRRLAATAKPASKALPPDLTATGTPSTPVAPTVVTKASVPGTASASPAVPSVPVRPPPPLLSAANVNVLHYRDLAGAARELAKGLEVASDPSREGVLLWAWYRLAALGDDAAHNSLESRAPAPNEAPARGELAAAAAGGLLLLDAKQAAARAFSEKLLRTRFRDSAAVALVAGRTYAKPAEVPKGLKHFDAVLAKEPQFVDARLARAKLGLARPDMASAAANDLVSLATRDADPAASLEAVGALLTAGHFEAADNASAAWKASDAADVPVGRQNAFWQLLTRRCLRYGDLEGARTAAQGQLEASPGSVTAMIELASVMAATDSAAAQKQLGESAKRLRNSDDIARLAVERARLFIRAGDAKSAAEAVAAPGGNPAAVGWLKYGQGLVALFQHQLPQARAAFTAAAQGRPNFVEPQVALVELSGSGMPVVVKLTALLKRSNSALASFRLARALLRMGNASSAATLFDKVLWTDPSVADSRELLSLWTEALDRAGQKQRVAAMVQAMRTARPQDELPLRLTIGLAERAGKTADVVEARKALLALAPDDIGRKIDVARALTTDGKSTEAERLLGELQRQESNRKNPELILELGRAWSERDPVKARMLMQDSIALAPRAVGYAALGDLEAKLGRTDEATAAFRKALELDPDLVELRYGLVRIMNQKRAFADSATELRRLVAADPQDVHAREMLGDAMQELNDPKAAAAAFQGAIDAGGDNPAILMKLARTQMEQLGLVVPAVKTLRRVIKIDAKLADAHYYLGLALKDMGKAAEARSELKAYLSLAAKGEFAKDAQRLVDDLERTP